jgi:nucleotide-binding universal stress UspA family protein
MFKRILFCTDFSENSHLAFTYALNLARTYQGKLFILHVTHIDPILTYPDPVYAYVPEETIKRWEASQKQKVDQQLNTNYFQQMDGFTDYKTLLKKGVPFYEIIQTAKEESVDLIVMGTHGKTGLDYVLFGSTAERVVRKSLTPVLTVRLPGKQFVMP